MSDVLSNWAANKALSLFSGKLYLACHLADPTALGRPVTEVAGGGYARQKITFGAASNRTRASTNAQTFPGLPESIVTYLAVWNSLGGGDMVFAVELDSPLQVPESGQVQVKAGDVAITL